MNRSETDDSSHPAREPGFYGMTYLQFAAGAGELELVRNLVNNGEDVTAQDQDGDTPLHAAAANAHMPVVAFLLDAGADPHLANNEGSKPSDWVGVAELVRTRAQPAPAQLSAYMREKQKVHDLVAGNSPAQRLAQLEAENTALRAENDQLKSQRDRLANSLRDVLGDAQPSVAPKQKKPGF